MAHPTLFSSLTPDDFKRLSPEQREVLGVPAPPPGLLRRFVEGSDFLANRKLLRSLFGLDRTETAEPSPFEVDQLKNGRTLSWYEQQLSFENSRLASYRLVQEISQFGLCATALSLFAEDATQYDVEHGRSVWIESPSADVKRMLTSMLDRCQIEDRIYAFAYSSAIFGDNFENVIYSRNEGVLGLRYTHPANVTRIEDPRGVLLGFVPELLEDEEVRRLKMDELRKRFEGRFAEPWDFIHFRLMGGRRTGSHGMSLILDARRTWRIVKMLQDAIVLYRLNRAPTRLVFKIDTGSQNTEEQRRTLNTWRQYYRKRTFLSTSTGIFRQEYNPLGVDEDIFMSVAKDKATDITKLDGSPNANDIGDLEHFVTMLAGDLGVPKAFLTGDTTDLNARATLVALDVRYARRVKRLQRALIYGLTQLCRIHLALLGKNPLDQKNMFEVHMAPISQLDELQRIETYSNRVQLAQNMLSIATDDFDKQAWARFVLRDFVKLSDAQVADYVPYMNLSRAGMPPGEPGMPGMPADVGGPPGEGPGAGLGGPDDLGGGPTVPRNVALDREPAGGSMEPGMEAEPNAAEQTITTGLTPPQSDRVILTEADGKLPTFQQERVFDLDAEKVLYAQQQKLEERMSTCPACKSKDVVVVLREDRGTKTMLCHACPFVAELEP